MPFSHLYVSRVMDEKPNGPLYKQKIITSFLQQLFHLNKLNISGRIFAILCFQSVMNHDRLRVRLLHERSVNVGAEHFACTCLDCNVGKHETNEKFSVLLFFIIKLYTFWLKRVLFFE